jgi:hypothetical protein
MNTPLKITGGARIGWFNATWPFAKLSASSQQLSISGIFIGSYNFSPDQIAAFEPFGFIPVLSSGVRIVHTVQDYPEKIIFWCFGSPQRLIQRITKIGFIPIAPRAQVPHREGIAFRWSFLILAVVVWNALFILDGFVPWKESKGLGLYSFLAVALLFLTALALKFSNRFQTWVIKPGRSIAEVRSVVVLVLVVSSIMLIAFGAQHFAS